MGIIEFNLFYVFMFDIIIRDLDVILEYVLMFLVYFFVLMDFKYF